MAESERIVEDARGENLGSVFLFEVAKSFHALLTENGIVGEQRERLLCGLIFDLATKLDGDEEVVYQGTAHTPILAFRVGADGTTVVYSKRFDYHEYAHAAAYSALKDAGAE